MRRGELLNLKLTAIDSKRMTISVLDAKGGKDRYTVLGKQVLLNLRAYFVVYTPTIYLFEGTKKKGTSLRYIQTLLGHSSSKTTEIYTHVAVKN